MQSKEGLLNKKWGFIRQEEKIFIRRRANNTLFLYIKCNSYFTEYITRVFLLSFAFLLACLVAQTRHVVLSIPVATLQVENVLLTTKAAQNLLAEGVPSHPSCQ